MPIDKSWMQKSRVSTKYHKRVLEFLGFAFNNAPRKEMLSCPCIRCNNCLMQKQEIMYDHLLDNGIARNYVRWLMHGEYEFCELTNTSTNESHMHDEMQEMLNDAFGMSMPNEESERSPHVHEEFEKLNEDANKFYNFLREVEHELYLGCKKFTKLSFIIRLFHMNCLNGWSNKSFTMLLELLKEALPKGETLPSNYYEAKKILRDLGLHYIKIDACPSDCMLYSKEHANANECVVCGVSR
ncbi:hypothetical protein PVL29_003747 [Vitis rotundifolia]|uniref:Transposase-associated domain-containing protein n=1 Tax=Vitis rotundifolia TaxID=103349 RepID=A0AA39E171_VITRO|nr:hypothetical protein PVL29_003747 [Vitis rotundifolia]